jgi:transcriptional regulator with XRE-family HTH domain
VAADGLVIEELIKQARQAKGLTQASLADRLARASGQSTVTRNEVSRWERGKRMPLAWLPWLSIVLDLPLSTLDQAVVLPVSSGWASPRRARTAIA